MNLGQKHDSIELIDDLSASLPARAQGPCRRRLHRRTKQVFSTCVSGILRYQPVTAEPYRQSRQRFALATRSTPGARFMLRLTRRMPQEDHHHAIAQTRASTWGYRLAVVTATTGAFASNRIQFPMAVSAGAKACLPHAAGLVTDVSVGPVEELKVQVAGLPKNTDFDFFVIQDPVAPFGLSWYQGDIETDAHGEGSGYFIGRFSVETFIVAPNVTAAPLVFNNLPFPDASARI